MIYEALCVVEGITKAIGQNGGRGQERDRGNCYSRGKWTHSVFEKKINHCFIVL